MHAFRRTEKGSGGHWHLDLYVEMLGMLPRSVRLPLSRAVIWRSRGIPLIRVILSSRQDELRWFVHNGHDQSPAGDSGDCIFCRYR